MYSPHIPFCLSLSGSRSRSPETLDSGLQGDGEVPLEPLHPPLRNLPRAPRHNAWAERAIGELKAESGLGSGVELADVDEALRRLEEARTRLDDLRPRPCLDGCTARAVDAAMPSAYTEQQRAAFFDEVRVAVEVAVGCIHGARARRLAAREAVFRVLERRALLRRTRGGVPSPSATPDTTPC